MKDLIESIEDFYENIASLFVYVTLIITSPLWIFPYVIYKKIKGGAE